MCVLFSSKIYFPLTHLFFVEIITIIII